MSPAEILEEALKLSLSEQEEIANRLAHCILGELQAQIWEAGKMKDVFEVVTGQILKQLEGGIIPWRRPWTSNGPTSYATNKEYQGINTLLLQSNYESPYWLTFRQAQKMGGSIRAGEKGSPIVFVDRMIKEETNEGRAR